MPSILFSIQISLSHNLLLFDLIYAQLSVGLNRRPIDSRPEAAESKPHRDAIPSSDNRSVSHLSAVQTVLPSGTSQIARIASVVQRHNVADVTWRVTYAVHDAEDPVSCATFYGLHASIGQTSRQEDITYSCQTK